MSDYKDESATVAGLRAALEEETELRLETERRLRTAKTEFQGFALSVSHDLREAIRTVNTYCELVAQEARQHPDTGSESFRPHVGQAVERIQTLLTGIVEYAAAEPEGRKLADVNMNRAFDEAARKVMEASGQSKPKLVRDALPVVKGDSDKLGRVLRHLLDNAVKYSGRDDPEAHLAARRDDLEWVFSLRDNGPGIEATYSTRIFELFKRLHGKELPGSGLGLAYCKKVIEWHGGLIWVESRPGEGSTFLFTLPAAD